MKYNTNISTSSIVYNNIIFCHPFQVNTHTRKRGILTQTLTTNIIFCIVKCFKNYYKLQITEDTNNTAIINYLTTTFT